MTKARMPKSASGLVDDGEILQRGLAADCLDEHGVPSAKAFPVADLKDAARKGISVHRKSSMDEASADGPLAHWPSHVEAKAAHVRAIRGANGRQAFEVHAAPTEDDQGHALIRFADASDPPASARLERDKLLDAFREPPL